MKNTDPLSKAGAPTKYSTYPENNSDDDNSIIFLKHVKDPIAAWNKMKNN
jgi:hypothetical protein